MDFRRPWKTGTRWKTVVKCKVFLPLCHWVKGSRSLPETREGEYDDSSLFTPSQECLWNYLTSWISWLDCFLEFQTSKSCRNSRDQTIFLLQTVLLSHHCRQQSCDIHALYIIAHALLYNFPSMSLFSMIFKRHSQPHFSSYSSMGFLCINRDAASG